MSEERRAGHRHSPTPGYEPRHKAAMSPLAIHRETVASMRAARAAGGNPNCTVCGGGVGPDCTCRDRCGSPKCEAVST